MSRASLLESRAVVLYTGSDLDPILGSELQQFLLKYTEIPGSCVCKACERSIQ